MDLADLTNPVPKGFLDGGDKMFVFDGEDVCLVPVEKAHKYETVKNVMGGIVAADDTASVGQIDVEDLIVAMVGIDQALKGAETGEFENKYSEKFDIQSVRGKLKINEFLPPDTSLKAFSIVKAEQGSALEADFFFYPESNELVAEQWSGEVIVSEGATPLPNVKVENGGDSSTLHIFCTQSMSRDPLFYGTYTIVLRRIPVGLYTELEVEGSIEIE